MPSRKGSQKPPMFLRRKTETIDTPHRFSPPPPLFTSENASATSRHLHHKSSFFSLPLSFEPYWRGPCCCRSESRADTMSHKHYKLWSAPDEQKERGKPSYLSPDTFGLSPPPQNSYLFKIITLRSGNILWISHREIESKSSFLIYRHQPFVFATLNKTFRLHPCFIPAPFRSLFSPLALRCWQQR